MSNLLEQTIIGIAESGHDIADIIFIGSEDSGHECSWEEFCKLADVDYDSGYGAPEVATDLIIVFSDGAKMWRSEYDGSEWWEYSAPFKRPNSSKKIKRLVVSEEVGWRTLAELNK